MRNSNFSSRQRGITLIVGLIILTVTTILTLSAFTLSGGNLKAVGNMQFRNEAIAAANMAIEQTINVNFATFDPASYPTAVNIDIDQDNTTDYVVNVNAPICIRAAPAPINSTSLSGVNSNVTNSSDILVLWEIDANAVNQATGTSVRAKHGINKRLSLSLYAASTCDANLP